MPWALENCTYILKSTCLFLSLVHENVYVAMIWSQKGYLQKNWRNFNWIIERQWIICYGIRNAKHLCYLSAGTEHNTNLLFRVKILSWISENSYNHKTLTTCTLIKKRQIINYSQKRECRYVNSFPFFSKIFI